LDPYVFNEVARILVENAGAIITPTRHNMRAFLARIRKRGFKAPRAYIRYAKAHLKEELPFLLDLGLVHTTAFGRDAALWKDIYENVLEKHTGPLRVLSLGCSNGVELATVALLAMTKLANVADLTIDAWDIAPGIVERAQNPRFQRRYLARLPVPVSPEHLQEIGKRDVHLAPTLAARINARVGDVRAREDGWWGFKIGVYDLVLCRNLLTYLNPKDVSEVFTGIWHTATLDACLGIGSVDPLPPEGLFKQVAPMLYRVVPVAPIDTTPVKP